MISMRRSIAYPRSETRMEGTRYALFFLVLIYSFIMNNADVSGTEREALVTFKRLVSDPQNTLLGWNHSTSICNWLGVSCTNNPNLPRVQSLQLGGFGLSGTIPPQLSNLSSLKILNLSNNLFHGPIPQEFGHLSLLQRLILSNNSIDSIIPTTLSHCSNLRQVDLSYNRLLGNLPSQLGFLMKLKHLNVAVNNLSGSIPPSFGNLSSLTHLYLSRNQFSGTIPNELGRLRKILILHLSQNNLTGDIPHSIYNISSMIMFSVTENELAGKLPHDMMLALPNLKELYISRNNLTGPIPSSLSNASTIQFLDLGSNRFEGVIPSLGNLKNLNFLNLGMNLLSSTTEMNRQVFDSLTNCTHLEVIILASNQLAGELPITTANLSTHLREICLGNNYYLSGVFPIGMENYRNLTVLDLQQNSFRGLIPNSIGLLKNLNKFSLQQNMFFGEIPNSFSNLTQLFQLIMGANQFSGRIPESIGDCQNLNLLDLAKNRLNGSIPTKIFRLSNLHELHLGGNALSGSLPIEVGKLSQLGFLDTSDNKLSGNIPETIDGCSSLVTLIMAKNKLNGSIPNSMGRLAALETLNLSLNDLSGQIPDGLQNLRVLKSLNLSFNDLEGYVPREGIFANISWNSLQGNNKLCSGDQEMTEKLKLPTCAIKKKQNISIAFKIIVPIVSFIALICVSSCLIWVFVVQKKKKQKRESKGSKFSPSYKGRPQKISYKQILSATNNFASENLIGKGGFGSVYRGISGDGDGDGEGDQSRKTIIAIKILNLKQSKASKSFTAECEVLKNVRHRNLVKVITSCSSIDHRGEEFKALIMEFMSNGSLEKWLYPDDPESGLRLNLMKRLNIAIDVASAMDYLHHDCEPPIVHCDLKPGNVLLDEDMVAHVGDFGLARILSCNNPSQDQSSTIGVMGSTGYIAPEYGLGSNASTSGDVYSYGILLLEIFTGRKPTDEMFRDGLDLNIFASSVDKNRIREIIDSRIFDNNNGSDYNSSNNNYSVSTTSSSSSTNNWKSREDECFASVIRVGLACAADLPKARLTMRETLTKMHEIKGTLLEL